MDEQEKKSFIVNTYINWLAILKSAIMTQKHDKDITKLDKEVKQLQLEKRQMTKEMKKMAQENKNQDDRIERLEQQLMILFKKN